MTQQFRSFSMMRILGLITLISAALIFHPALAADDPLPSWNDAESRKAIVSFVERVTDMSSDGYVRPEDRIAVFDNDGTLWNEKPLYIHFFAIVDRMKEQMAADPTLKDREPYKALATKDKAYFTDLNENMAFDTLVGDLMAVPFGGMTTKEFDTWGRSWLKGWKHPKYNVGYQDLVYQPMVELILFLESNGFQVHIFTADEAAFLRLAAEEIYGLPTEQVHGSSVRLEYLVEGDEANLMRTYRMDYIDNWDAKPRLINQVLGKPPIFAAGNSNGDQHMLQYTALNGGMSVLVHHTDGEREDKYDAHTDKVMPLVQKESWTVIDMENDWKRVFPYQ
ncbi:haloacid dehalogenase-like hydrolase [Ruegeria sp. Ofav3-42]|uniref:haloacid dehalogenase-like hydrolase n=1 Tax=Ruegeria sp. Ofav3-42 TaxID=2917759 RepID=UPI001EF41C61|nr:haloacid dehalogenase-like hydrolase [Ruegeria sp. Ofav3-42]MCG7521677.1 haloacid dehalogenase-like hydrolase [Ruegeria sp. Ofav3-42]